MVEKMLFEIAVGRIIDRIAKANPGVKSEIVFLMREAADGKLSDENVKSGAIDYMIRNLFPELHESSEGK